MSLLVSKNQNAFIRDRLIWDNIIISHEVFHALKKNTRRARDSFVAKLDMSKAYNCLEWNFLESCLLAYVFYLNWVKLVMICVRGASYCFKINGIPS